MRSNTGLKTGESLSENEKSQKSSHDTDKNLSIFGGKGFNRPKLNWREFFNEIELDKAYQIVEVEQRDETDSQKQFSMGSDSDPSDDNLDVEEIYEDVYGIKNPGELLKTRKKRFD